MEWKLAEAKNKLTEVVNLALKEGPQLIRRRDDLVVLIAAEEYERMKGQKPDFKTYLFEGPAIEGLNIERDQSPPRNFEL